jgi:hypothetical protein
LPVWISLCRRQRWRWAFRCVLVEPVAMNEVLMEKNEQTCFNLNLRLWTVLNMWRIGWWLCGVIMAMQDCAGCSDYNVILCSVDGRSSQWQSCSCHFVCVWPLFLCVYVWGLFFVCVCVWPLCVYVWCLFLCVCGHFVCVCDCGGSLFVCVTTFSALFSYFSSHEVCTFFLVLILVFSSNAAWSCPPPYQLWFPFVFCLGLVLISQLLIHSGSVSYFVLFHSLIEVFLFFCKYLFCSSEIYQ